MEEEWSNYCVPSRTLRSSPSQVLLSFGAACTPQWDGRKRWSPQNCSSFRFPFTIRHEDDSPRCPIYYWLSLGSEPGGSWRFEATIHSWDPCESTSVSYASRPTVGKWERSRFSQDPLWRDHFPNEFRSYSTTILTSSLVVVQSRVFLTLLRCAENCNFFETIYDAI